MKLAVTGASGFIGVHLIHHLLKAGHEVTALKRSSTDLSQFQLISSTYENFTESLGRLHWVDCELHDVMGLEEILTDCDYLIHSAAVISYDKQDLDKLIRVNAGLTGILVDVCLNTNTSMALLSSTSAIPKNPFVEILDEAQEWDESYSYSNYGLSKHLAELEFWRGVEEGMSGFMVNPGIVLGFGNWNASSLQIFKKAHDSFPFYSTGSTAFTGVTDLCEVILKLLDKDLKPERFLVINENRSFQDILNIMAKDFGVKTPRIELKGLLLRTMKAMVWVKELFRIRGLISAETISSATSRFKFSNTKVKEATGHQFRTMEDVIAEAVVLYKKSSH